MRLIPWTKISDRLIKLGDVVCKQSITDKYKAVGSTFTPWEIGRMLGSKMEWYAKTQDLSNRTPSENMMLVDFIRYLPDDILVKVDRATMAVSIEGREPLLDHTILEFAAQLPLAYKHNKKILKLILSKYIPSELFTRTKHGFGIPVNHWLRNDLRFLIEEFCNSKAIQATGLLNVNSLQKVKKDFLSGKDDTPRMWYVLMFQMWFTKYMSKT